MKKLFLFFSAFFFTFNIFAEIPENEKCITETESSPFSVSPVKDGIAVGVLSASALTAYLLPYYISMPKYTEFTYDLDDVNSIDRKFAKKYSKTLDTCGDISLAFSYCLTPAVYGLELLNKNFQFKEGINLAVIYTESILATQTAKCFIKTAVKRKRPYMYFEDYPTDELDNYDFEFSFPSGHTTDSFMNAAFLTYTFCKYYPESNFKIPVAAASYSIAFGTAALRIASGNHFLTDTLSGAALGTAIGFAVPWLHTFGNKISTDKAEVQLSPMACSVKFKF